MPLPNALHTRSIPPDGHREADTGASSPHRRDPLISIVTVVLNGADHIEQTIQSVLGQDYPHIEYIIIDGGSTDGTLDIIRTYENRINYWVSEADAGIYDAMNKGIALAKGELIGLLNADDYYEPGAVAAAAERYAHLQAPCVLYGHAWVVNAELGLRYRAFARPTYWDGMGICHQAMFVHKEVYATAGNFDVTYRIAADYDFLIRALRTNIPFFEVDYFLVNYRASGMSAINLLKSLAENRSILKKYFGVFSTTYMIYAALCLKSSVLVKAEAFLGLFMDRSCINKLKRKYVTTFFAKSDRD